MAAAAALFGEGYWPLEGGHGDVASPRRTRCWFALAVSGMATVDLTSNFDSAGSLQLAHSTNSLVDYDDSVIAEYGTAGNVTFRIMDPAGWTVVATHERTTWSRGTDHAFHQFVPTTDFIEVEVTATSGSNSKSKLINVKTRPDGSLPGTPGDFGGG